MDSEGLHVKNFQVISIKNHSTLPQAKGKAQKGFLIFYVRSLDGKSKRKLIDGEGKNHRGCEFIGGGMGREGSKTR